MIVIGGCDTFTLIFMFDRYLRFMNYSIDVLSELENMAVSSAFAEGVILAANLACRPVEKSQWQSIILNEIDSESDAVLVGQFEAQYQSLITHSYVLSDVIELHLPSQRKEWANGLLNGRSVVEETWSDAPIDDGTQRLLQALITLCMLIVDGESTQQQMKEAGIDDIPTVEQLIENIDMILYELIQFSDSQLLGHGSQRVNPYKDVGRNDPCPCQSGKKFKACCGK